MKKLIKIYGERNTNTNYVSRLIALNLKATEVPGVDPPIVKKIQKFLPGNEIVRDIYFYLNYGKNLGWKHTYVKSSEELNQYKPVNADLIFLTITKNPYSWLLSLYRNPYHQYYSDDPDFETFLQRRWKTIGRDNVRSTPITPIELWNLKNKSYLHLDRKKTISITTEELFESPEGVIHQISKRYSIRKKSDSFINYERSTKDKSKDSAYYRDYYLSEKWRNNLSNEAISIINESIDKELMSRFSYNLLS